MNWSLACFDDDPLNLDCYQQLFSEKFNVIKCASPQDYQSILEQQPIHAFLLDVHMPELSGYELMVKIQNHPAYLGGPILFISADESVKNKLKSFEVGGADFLTRDLSPDEMVARIINKIKIFSELSPTLEVGNLKYNTQMMKAQINQVSLDLTILEFRILGHILRFYPNFLTRNDLVEKVWSPSMVKLGTVNTHLTNLREKLYLWDHDFKIRDEEILVLKKQS